MTSYKLYNTIMNYLVLGGGVSPESEVSHRSARAVQQALESLGHTATYVDPAKLTNEEIVTLARSHDGVFPILHGEGGEDGSLQELFEENIIPYFGPSTLSCANTYNKADFKKLLEANGLPTPRWTIVSLASFDNEPLIQQPFVLKPISGGSSIDTFIIRSLPFNEAPLKETLAVYGTMLLEELIDGDEVTVGVLNGKALPVIEIIPPINKEFDYENKYNGATQELCPPVNISAEAQATAQTLALSAHNITNCRHISRTDILINKNGEQFIIDTNTIPGLTNHSLFPKAAAAAGYKWVDLVDEFTKLVK